MHTPAGRWKKSSYSARETNCVEAARLPDLVGLRDSKTPEASPLAFPHREWVGFLREISADQHE